MEGSNTSEVVASPNRRQMLDNKQGSCPHCGHLKYVRNGQDKGAQRYKCASCKRNFTEYTGTWMERLHHKEKTGAYLGLMLEEKSLDAIKTLLHINKKTAFDWRHKILSSIAEVDRRDFQGVTESDETFFRFSEKGQRHKKNKPPKGRRHPKERGIGRDQVKVIVTQDRKNEIDLTVSGRGRLTKADISTAIGDRINTATVLCSDSHVSYKGFAKDNRIEHHALRSDMQQHLKDKKYHIQHVNSTHNKLKKWIGFRFWGVSTKYLQQYLNWYRLKELIKKSNDRLFEFAQKTIIDTKAVQKFKQIPILYQSLQISSLK